MENPTHSRRLQTSILLSLLVGLFLPGFAWEINASTVYVSPQGSDQSPGTRSRPFATLNRAIAATRSMSSMQKRRIVLRSGQYWETAVVLDARDNGLVIQAAKGEDPVLFGGRLLTGFRTNDGPLLVADLPTNTNGPVFPDFRMLWVNGSMAPRARYPETGFVLAPTG